MEQRGTWLVRAVLFIGVTAALSLLPRHSSATDWPQLTIGTAINGIAAPVNITHAGDGSGRLFVVQQTGYIRLVTDGVLQPTPFLSISARVSYDGGERGLLGLAFPPGYATKGYFYVDYTNVSGNTVIARYHLSTADLADPNSEEILLTITQPFANHNGGQLAFGLNDGYLYIGMGDGGSGGDPNNNGQSTDVLLGKLLRIDVESGVTPYGVPATNPYVNTSGYQPEIWALGLRNPWRFSFDRANSDLYIADVGQNLHEEIDYQPASSTGGENYGWRIMEGFHCYNPDPCSSTGLTLPVIEYDHTENNCAVIGGFVYRGSRYPRMRGVYFYGDYCTGRIWGLVHADATWTSQFLIQAPFSLTAFGEDEGGELYVADYGDGAVAMLTDPTAACLTDVDANSTSADVATDIVYIVRTLLQLPPVPGQFRAVDPTIPSDPLLAVRVKALGSALDVDGNGVVDVATDLVYIARHLLSLTPVPTSFRDADPSIPSDSTIAANIDALCPG